MTEDKRKFRIVLPDSGTLKVARTLKKAAEIQQLVLDARAIYKTADTLNFIHAQHDLSEADEIEVAEGLEPAEIVKVEEEPQPEPPAAADFIITALMGSKAADAAIGDLTEVFRKDISSGMSLTRAKAKYWGEVFFLAGPMLKELAKRLGLMVLAGKLLG